MKTSVPTKGSLATLEQWLEGPRAARARDALGAALDESSWVLERDHAQRAVARVRSQTGTAHALAPRGDSWFWTMPADDEALELGRWTRDRVRARTALRPLIEEIDRIEPVAYRPGRRLVLRIRGRTHEGPCVLYAKGLRPRAFERSRRLHRALAASTMPGLALPVLECEDDSALVFRAVEGRTLHEAGRENDPVEASALRGVLSSLERFSVPEGVAVPARTLASERASAATMLRRAAELDPSLEALAARVEAIPLPSAEGPTGLVHGDLHDKQLLVGAEGVRLIDLDTAGLGPVWVDRVNLLEHLALRVDQGRWKAAWGEQMRWAVRGAEPEPVEAATLRLLVRARLVGVYALRPAQRAISRRLRARFEARIEARAETRGDDRPEAGDPT